MRIISGIAGGLPLDVPRAVTRPTQDRVRQAVFSMLGDLVVGTQVLDLFAGSGALGIECLSRGAASALMVDQDRGAAETIRLNLAKTRLPGGTVRQGEVMRVLAELARAQAAFDLVFADPPYAHQPGDVDWAARLLENADLSALLKPGGSLVLECMAGKRPLAVLPPWQIERDREYGSTRVLWLRKTPLPVDEL